MKIFFEMTSTYQQLRQQPAFNGIQRVTATLAVETHRLLGEDKVHIMILTRNGFMTKSVSEMGPDTLMDPTLLRRHFHSGAWNGQHDVPQLAKYRSRPLKRRFHKARLDLMARLQPVTFEGRTGLSVAQWRKLAASGQAASMGLPFSSICTPGDVVLSMDATWDKETLDSLASLRRTHDVRIMTMVHDLIPLVAGFTTPPGLQVPFIHWLEKSREYTDMYLANSVNTCRDFIALQQVQGNTTPVVTLPLAQEMPKTGQVSRTASPVSAAYAESYPRLEQMATTEPPLRYLMSAPYVLCVGTLEPRKNNLRLLQAWEYLSRQNPDLPRLVFAGRRGWGLEDFDELLRASGRLGGRVSIIESPSDQHLDMLYSNCLFFAYPSLYEGWGLPIGEGLSHGKTGVVAHNSSLMEVGQDMVEYCDAESVKSIAAAVDRLLLDPTYRKSKEDGIARTALRSWRDVASDLVCATLKM